MARTAAETATGHPLPRLRRQRICNCPLRPRAQPAPCPLRRLRVPAPLPTRRPAGLQRRAALPGHARTRPRPAGAGGTVRRRRLHRGVRARRRRRGRRTRVPAAQRRVLPRPPARAGIAPVGFALLAVAGTSGAGDLAETARLTRKRDGRHGTAVAMRYAASPQQGPKRSMLLYQLHEAWRAGLAPYAYWADAGAKMYSAHDSWLSSLPGAQRTAAAFELMYRLGKDYEKPEFGIHSVEIDGVACPVVERVAIVKQFCRLLRFMRYSDDQDRLRDLRDDPSVLVVAPLSGHHATLLRDTVRTLLQDHKVYVTDWTDARMVPAEQGPFTLDDYVGYVQDFIRAIGAADLHVISVCQPTVPVLAAVSLMAARGEPVPRSMVMMGGPIDTRESPTAVNNLATRQPLWWFENNVIHNVPANYPGAGRRVYPGFLQHMGFMAMNPERHAVSHWDFYQDLLKGDLEDAEAHRRFYD